MSNECVGLPNGWVEATVGDIADYINGLAFKPSDWATSGRPIIRIQNLTKPTAGFNFTASDVPRKFVVKAGDLLVSWSATLDVFRWDGPEGVLNQHIFKVVPVSAMEDHRFVRWALKNAVMEMWASEHTHGTTMRHINRGPFLAHRLSLPPVQEQQRIGDALDSYLSRLDAAVASLEQAQTKLKAYRSSVLKTAVEGRLVPTEAELARRENRDYEPASVLLDRILKERRRRWEEAELARLKKAGKMPKDDKWKAKYQEPVEPDLDSLPALPEGWCWATVDSFLCAIEAGKNFACDGRPPERDEVGVVKVSAVTWGTFDELESKTCTRPELVDSRWFITAGDFLFSRANTLELVGACVIVGGVVRTLMLSDKILRLRLVGGLDQWVLWCLRSAWGRREIEAHATGNQLSMRNISQSGIRKIRIPIPPADEARRLVDAIESRLSVASQTEGQAEADSGRCHRLRQSLLKWAFDGKLVDQDPSDEPAGQLLARIRAGRAAPAPVKKNQTKKTARRKS